MEGSRGPNPGFSNHVQDQLRQAAMNVSTTDVPVSHSGRGRGPRGRGRGRFRSANQLYHQVPVRQYNNGPQPPQQGNSQPRNNQIMLNLADTTSFPPPGAPRQQPPAAMTQQQQYQPGPDPPVQTQHYQAPPPHYHGQPPSHSSPGPQVGFYRRGRGGPLRGGLHRSRAFHGFPGDVHPSHAQGQFQPQNGNDFHGPAPMQRRLFQPGNQPQFNTLEQQREYQQRLMDQSDFLNHLANKSLKNQLTTEEQQAKECFRKELETIAQKVIASACTKEMQLNPEHVQLRLYGSLGSGFAVAGSDMDLLLAFPQNEGPLGDVEIESRRMLEKALLDAGMGARLLTNTRVPILRVCEKPSPELLKNLRDYRLRWEESLTKDDPPPVDKGFGPLPTLTDTQTEAAVIALADLDLDAHEVPLPGSPTPEHAKLEYTGDCGIQCDINFSNYVALHNTRLLKTYGMCDPRVRQVGVFVKSWVKAKDINTPYRGTLSSYGYILMVLHYLINVANPPVLPNLQDLAKHKDTWEGKTDVELVEGFDVRFIQDMNEVQEILREMPRNHETVGQLLRGFFWYYSDLRGFHWNQDVLSIRSRSGRLTKRSKGWTEAKWSNENSNVRLRYLLAIEDPFELEHNVGRTVGHSGIVAIRDEFRRAWSTIENIQFDNKSGMWFSLTQEGQRVDGDEMIAVVEHRGDLLRKDQDYHRQKVRRLKLELEAKEKAFQNAAAHEAESQDGATLNGMSEEKFKCGTRVAQPLIAPSPMTLMNCGGIQVTKCQQKLSRRRPIQEPEEEMRAELEPVSKSANGSKLIAVAGMPLNVEQNSSLIEEGVKNIKQVQKIQHSASNEQEASAKTIQPVPMTSSLTKPSPGGICYVTIEWDRTSRDGKWLRWRDRQIELGKWSEESVKSLNPMWRRLSEKFPYDPNMTVADLATKNEILRKSNTSDTAPEKRAQQKQMSAPGPPLRSESDRDMDTIVTSTHLPSATVLQEPSIPENHGVEIKHNTRNDTSQSSTSPNRNVHSTTTPHQRMLSSQNQQSLKVGLILPDHAERQNLSTSKPTSPDQIKRSTKRKDSAISSLWDIPSSINPTKSVPKTNPHTRCSPQSTQPSRQVQTFVPVTLHPTTPANFRPRDEVPNTTPLPQPPNFRFDPRQLADLEVIRRGGNGCAVRGEEFEVDGNEDWEYDGRGGGWTGITDGGSGAGTASQKVPKLNPKHNRLTTKWSARGDEDGLLDELPRGSVIS